MKNPERSVVRSWVIVGLCSAFILLKGAFAFFVVGDLGQPDWDYRPIKDVPAESPYALYDRLPDPQHVRGGKGE